MAERAHRDVYLLFLSPDASPAALARRALGAGAAPGQMTTMPKPIKLVFAVLIGFVVWFIVATIANMLIRAALPGYAEAELATRFTLPMLLTRLAVGAISSAAAGLACALAARSIPLAVKILAAALVLFFVPVHYSLWTKFPLWYHALFLVSLAPLVLGGAGLAHRFASRVRSARH